MKSNASVNLGPLSKSGDISVTHNEYHGIQLDDDIVLLLTHFLKTQTIKSMEIEEHIGRDVGLGDLKELFFQAVQEGNAVSAARLLPNVGAHSGLGTKGCQAAVLLGNKRLMTECLNELRGAERKFWEARVDLLSGQQAESIKTSVEYFEEMNAANLGAAACRNIANALGDLGLWAHSIRLLVVLMNSEAVKSSDRLQAQVLTDLLRARCRPTDILL